MPKRPLVLAFVAAMVLLDGRAASAAPGIESCPVSTPRFEPKLRKRPAPEDVKFLGGARLSKPVAAPCLKRAGEVEA